MPGELMESDNTRNILGYSVRSKETIRRIGKGTEREPYRPDTTEKYWQKVNETETGYEIEILQE